MRLDKWLKISRLIKRRAVAQLACLQGRVFVNERAVKSAHNIKPGDLVHLELGSYAITVEVVNTPDKPIRVKDAPNLYLIKEEIKRQPEILN